MMGQTTRTRDRAARLTVVVAIFIAALAPLTAAPADAAPAITRPIVTCTSDSCDGGLWGAARGASNEISYWGMGAGHNCTNYVAWKLISNGVDRPNISLGDAAQWADSAVSNGIVVNRTPAIGSVAQWDAFASNVGMYGHVAYVEKVNADGTILISEDAWRPNNRGGPLTFRIVDATSVSHFLHFGDNTRWIREVSFEVPVPVTAPAEGEAALQPGDVAPSIPLQQIAYPSFALPGETVPNPFVTPVPGRIEPDRRVPVAPATTPGPSPSSEPTPTSSEPAPTQSETPTEVPSEPRTEDPSPNPSPTEAPSEAPPTSELPVTGEPAEPVWQQRSTGLLLSPTAMSAVTMGGGSTQLVFAEDGKLSTATRSPDGWTVAETGVTSRAGKLVAVDMGGQWPQVVSIDDGKLFLSAASLSGWQKMPTGIAVTGEMAALDMGGLWPTIMVAQNDKLFQVRRGMQGWQVSNTGLAVGGPITAVNVGGIPQVFAIEDGVLQQLWADERGWNKKSTGIPAVGAISAVVVGGAVQVILIEDGVLKQVTLDSSGWHKFPTAILAGTEATAVDIGQATPLIIQAG